MPEWPTLLPCRIIARLSRVWFLKAKGDDVQTSGDGAVPVLGRVLVAATGDRVAMSEADHQLALSGPCLSSEGFRCMAEVMEVQHRWPRSRPDAMDRIVEPVAYSSPWTRGAAAGSPVTLVRG